MRQNILVSAIALGVLCFVIGLISGALLTIPNREKTKATIASLEDKEERIQTTSRNQIETAKEETNRLQGEINHITDELKQTETEIAHLSSKPEDEQIKENEKLKITHKEDGIVPEPNAEKEKVIMPTYEVLNEDVYEIPLKTQVTLDILVSGEITEPGLNALLNSLYSSTRVRTGFKYHEHPTSIYIYAFTSKEKFEAGMGQWIAKIGQNYGDVEPKIIIDERRMALLGAKPEEKFGLSEIKRIEIWKEYLSADDRAREKEEERYPYISGLSRSQLQKRAENLQQFRQQLEKQYKGNLAKKYGLTLKQLEEIADEGETKDWPVPKDWLMPKF